MQAPLLIKLLWRYECVNGLAALQFLCDGGLLVCANDQRHGGTKYDAPGSHLKDMNFG